MPRITWTLPTAIVTAAIVAATAYAFQQPGPGNMPARTTVLHNGKVPIGSLGKPLGTYVTIEGKRYPHRVEGSQWVLVVSKVDGKKLAKPVNLWIDNIGRMSAKGQIVLKGYENARMVGVPPAYATASREDHEKPPAWTLRPNVKWQMELYFTVLKVVSR